MSIPREQFDELLGGKEVLPGAISIIKFANARGNEITALTEAIEDPQNNHLAFQKMPKHLRRRAMSHNYKRMPKHLQGIHLSQMEKNGLPIKSKRPSRKFRRKPCNLLQEYNRRQRTFVWLETHIWHAKRFHMVERWGYKLPHFPKDKGFRACYRATTKHCLVQDVSYLNCIELKGPERNILQGLSQLTNPDCGLTFAAKSSLTGSREGNVMVFKKGTYPFHAIGRVSFIWRPEVEDGSRTLWIWCHPAFYSEFLQELISVFEFILVETTEMDIDPVQKKDKFETVERTTKDKKNVEQVKLDPKNIGRLPKYSNKKVVMSLLKETLNRFRLTGPLAQVVLTEALKFVNINDYITSELKSDEAMDVDNDDKPRSEWLQNFYNNNVHLNSLKQQQSYWDNLLKDVNSAAELPPRMILPATVMDPRLSMPTTRIKAVNTGEIGVQTVIPEGLSCNSPLWDTDLRDSVTHSKMSVSELNNLRNRAVVPGLSTPSWLGFHNVSHLPLLLVQNPGCGGQKNQQGYGSGWDVIAPAGWGMPLWLGFVFRGARAGGLRETEKLTLETASGPYLPPDTKAGRELSEHYRIEKEKKHFRLPPDKRPNYIKLGVVSPFHCPWEKLLQDWFTGEGNRRFYVIRNQFQLEFLQRLPCIKNSAETSMFSESDKACGLVQVGLEMCGRGTIKSCAVICALCKKDLKLIKDKSGRGPIEPQHEDENEGKRKTLREYHLTKLKRLRRKRVKAKRELESEGYYSVDKNTKKSPTEDLVSAQAELMKELWLPSEIKKVKNSSSRSVLGFVMHGDYAFTQSRCFGYGFVALSALLSILQTNQAYVLVRNTTSLQYYFAKLKLLPPT